MNRFTTRVFINRANLTRRIKLQVHPAINNGLDELQGIFAEQAAGVKTGRVYRRARGSHQASAAGESPADDSGNLLRTIQIRFPALTVGQLWITAPYARALERGTARMAARPFIKPAVRTFIQRWRGGRF